LAGLWSAGNEGLPEVLLMDVGLPGRSGVEVIGEVLELVPECRVLILTVFEDEKKIGAAISAGACGYLVKTARQEEIVAAIHEAAEGGSPMSPTVAARVVKLLAGLTKPKTVVSLSPRECEILGLIVEGMTAKEIADRLEVSIHTTDTHTRNLFRKLGVNSRATAVARAMRDRLVWVGWRQGRRPRRLLSLLGDELFDGTVDSFDLWPAILGKKEPIREHLLTQSFRGEFQIRKGNWKYLDHKGSGGNGYDAKILKKYVLPEFRLDDMGCQVGVETSKLTSVKNDKKIESTKSYDTIKLGIDAHAKWYYVARQLDGVTPQPVQKRAFRTIQDGIISYLQVTYYQLIRTIRRVGN
jgi:DNA-binding NarL/FixJ family response regulator